MFEILVINSAVLEHQRSIDLINRRGSMVPTRRGIFSRLSDMKRAPRAVLPIVLHPAC